MGADDRSLLRFKVSAHELFTRNWPLHVMVLGYIILFSVTSLIRHLSFQTSAWDLGIFDQAFYSVLRGRFFYYTPELYANPGGSVFGVHFSPILFAVLPFYALFQNPMTLLVVQSAAIGAGAYPVFLITQHVLKDRKLGYYFAFFYLVYPHVYSINIFDFHPDAFFVLFALFALYYFLKGSWKQYMVFMFLSLSTKEFMSVIFGIFGVVELLNRRVEVENMLRSRTRPSGQVLAILTTLVATTTWYIAARQFITFFNPFTVQGFAEGSPWSVLGFIPLDPSSWFHPEHINLLQAVTYDFQLKLFYLVTIFAPLAFLPFFKISRASPALLWVAVAFLSNYPPYYQLGYQYSALIAPFIIVASIEGFARVQSLLKADIAKTTKIAHRLLLTCVLVSMVLIFQNLPLSLQSVMSPHDQKLGMLVENIHKQFPGASILTQYDLFPHFSTSLKSYVVPPLFSAFNKTYYAEYVASLFDLKPDFIILDMNPDVRTHALRTTYHYSFVNMERLDNQYGLYALVDGAFVYKRSYTGNPVTKEPFVLKLNYDFFIDNDVTLFNSVFPKGQYSVTYQMYLPYADSQPACTMVLAQGKLTLESKDLYGTYSYGKILLANYTATVNITSSSTEVSFSVLNPSTSIEVYMKSIVISMISLQDTS